MASAWGMLAEGVLGGVVTRMMAALLPSCQSMQLGHCHLLHAPEMAATSTPTLVPQVSVQWTEMAGSKIKPTSVLHMAFELACLKLGYQWLGTWRVYEELDLHKKLA